MARYVLLRTINNVSGHRLRGGQILNDAFELDTINLAKRIAPQAVARLPSAALELGAEEAQARAAVGADPEELDTIMALAFVRATSSGYQLDNPWLQQTEWYIDAVNGDDANDGATADTALASHAELERRWGETPVLSDFYTINILSDLDETIRLRVKLEGTTGSLLYVGTPTAVVFSGEIATSNSFGQSSEGWLTAVGLSDWTPYLGKQLRSTSGFSSGWAWFLTKIASASVGNETVRVGSGRNQTAPFPPSGVTCQYTNSVPNPGATFDIVELPTVKGIDVRCDRLDADGDGFSSPIPRMVFQDLLVKNQSFSTLVRVETERASSTPRVLFWGCQFSDSVVFVGDAAHLRACSFVRPTGGNASVAFYGMNLEVQGCSFSGSALFEHCTFANSSSSIDYCYFEGKLTFVDCAMTHASALSKSDGVNIAIWSSDNQYGLMVDEASTIYFRQVWGELTGNGDGFNIRGRAYYVPTINGGKLTDFVVSGTGSDVKVGGVTAAYASLPIITAANNAMFVEEFV